ncbi:hypothetical protein BKA70DRAFT_1433385 [Coprinopsis sp. MPI-PUGE-AT-0042]|nr:hypothetical protein BKA70DRAFT_1433385 [Coprinopsis sp. MPI-PUGE-AT-0042]
MPAANSSIQAASTPTLALPQALTRLSTNVAFQRAQSTFLRAYPWASSIILDGDLQAFLSKAGSLQAQGCVEPHPLQPLVVAFLALEQSIVLPHGQSFTGTIRSFVLHHCHSDECSPGARLDSRPAALNLLSKDTICQLSGPALLSLCRYMALAKVIDIVAVIEGRPSLERIPRLSSFSPGDNFALSYLRDCRHVLCEARRSLEHIVNSRSLHPSSQTTALSNQGPSNVLTLDPPAALPVVKALADSISLGSACNIECNILIAALHLHYLLQGKFDLPTTFTDIFPLLAESHRQTFQKLVTGKESPHQMRLPLMFSLFISPLVLLRSCRVWKLKFDRSHLLLGAIYLGNDSPEALKTISGIVWNCIFDIATTRIPVVEAIKIMVDTIPWDLVDSLSDDESDWYCPPPPRAPSPSPSQAMGSTNPDSPSTMDVDWLSSLTVEEASLLVSLLQQLQAHQAAGTSDPSLLELYQLVQSKPNLADVLSTLSNPPITAPIPTTTVAPSPQLSPHRPPEGVPTTCGSLQLTTLGGFSEFCSEVFRTPSIDAAYYLRLDDERALSGWDQSQPDTSRNVFDHPERSLSSSPPTSNITADSDSIPLSPMTPLPSGLENDEDLDLEKSDDDEGPDNEESDMDTVDLEIARALDLDSRPFTPPPVPPTAPTVPPAASTVPPTAPAVPHALTIPPKPKAKRKRSCKKRSQRQPVVDHSDSEASHDKPSSDQSDGNESETRLPKKARTDSPAFPNIKGFTLGAPSSQFKLGSSADTAIILDQIRVWCSEVVDIEITS